MPRTAKGVKIRLAVHMIWADTHRVSHLHTFNRAGKGNNATETDSEDGAGPDNKINGSE